MPTSYDDFITENGLRLLGTYLLACAAGERPELETPYPPASLEPDQLAALVSDLEDAMPIDGLIADLRDWDVRLYDELGDDWFFETVFGDSSSVTACSHDLSAVFVELVGRFGMDYDQQSDPDAFRELVSVEAETFVRNWRSRVFAQHASGPPSNEAE